MNEQGHENIRTTMVSMLRQCADYLAGLPASEVDAFIRGDVELRLTLTAKKRPPKKEPRIVLDSNVLLQLISQLQSSASRLEGEQLLKEKAPTKTALESLARKLELSIRKGEVLDDLKRRIIEATIGYRLASAAIQGKPPRDRENATPNGPNPNAP